MLFQKISLTPTPSWKFQFIIFLSFKNYEISPNRTLNYEVVTNGLLYDASCRIQHGDQPFDTYFKTLEPFAYQHGIGGWNGRWSVITTNCLDTRYYRVRGAVKSRRTAEVSTNFLRKLTGIFLIFYNHCIELR